MKWDKEQGTWERRRFHQDLGIGGYAEGSLEHQEPGRCWDWRVEVFFIANLDIGMGIRHIRLGILSGAAGSLEEALDAIPIAIQLILIKAHITNQEMGNLGVKAEHLMQALRRQSLSSAAS